VQGGWGGFSGVGYAFGLKLMRELGVHVGLIQSAWGGTSVEAWTDRASVQSTHEYDEVLSLLDQETEKGMPEMATYFDRWIANFDPGTKADWWRNAPDGGWQSLPSGTPLKGDRIHWLRIRFQAAASAELLQLGELEGCDQTTLNGQLIGTGSGRWTRQYVIPKGLLRSGTNEVIIRLAPAYGGIGLHGKPDTIGLVTAGRFSTLASQVEARDGVLLNAAPPPRDIEANPTVPTLLYNGMIAPIAPLSVHGAIWYQGETNMGRGIQYRKLLPAFFASWRKAFSW
jgi:sialate O-acetylesterase